MYTLKVENERGEILSLSQNESKYQIISVGGLNPPNASINSTEVAGLDGTKYNSSKLEERDLTITIHIRGEVERNRLDLYNYFKTKRWCKIYYSNDSRDVYCEGYVEAINVDLFTINETMQISIVCNDPYLKDVEEIRDDLSLIVGAFHFPFAIEASGIPFSTIDKTRQKSITNRGEGDVGIIIEIISSGDGVVNPAVHNITTGESFFVNGTLNTGDVLIIDTNPGRKRVTLNGLNAMNLVGKNTQWIHLQYGDNIFQISGTDSESLSVTVIHNNVYEAV